MVMSARDARGPEEYERAGLLPDDGEQEIYPKGYRTGVTGQCPTFIFVCGLVMPAG